MPIPSSLFSLRKCLYDHTECEKQQFDRKRVIHASYTKLKNKKKTHRCGFESITCETSKALLAGCQMCFLQSYD